MDGIRPWGKGCSSIMNKALTDCSFKSSSIASRDIRSILRHGTRLTGGGGLYNVRLDPAGEGGGGSKGFTNMLTCL